MEIWNVCLRNLPNFKSRFPLSGTISGNKTSINEGHWEKANKHPYVLVPYIIGYAIIIDNIKVTKKQFFNTANHKLILNIFLNVLI